MDSVCPHIRSQLVAILCVLTLALPARAQRVYDVVLQGVPLEEALTELMTSTDLVLGFDQRLVAGKWTNCVASQSTEEELLRCILHGTGVDYFRLPSGLYVLTERAEARVRYGALHGVVVDFDTGEPLEHAHIMLNPGHGTVSNQDGRFIFSSLKPGLYAVTTTYLGYSSRLEYIQVVPDSVAQARLALRQAVIVERTPVVIDGVGWRVPSDTLGQHTLDREALLRAAGGGMLADFGRAVANMVGVRLSDATADLHIQSSGTGEHQYRLDNAPVFVPVSIGGLIGPFSTYALSRITVHKTGFGADIGSQTAGVIDATHALGPRPGRHLDVHVDPMSVNARASHNLEDGSAIMAAGRLGLWDLYAPAAVQGMLRRWNQTDQFMYSAFRAVPQSRPSSSSYFEQSLATLDPGLQFSDAHFALRKRNGLLSSVHASAYWGRRQLKSQERGGGGQYIPQYALLQQAALGVQDRYVWDNLTGQIRYEAVLGARSLASVQARGSLFRLQHDISTSKITQQTVSGNNSLAGQVNLSDDNNNRVREYGAAGRITYALWRGWNVEAGLEPAYTHSRFLVHGTRTHPIAHASGTWRVESFIQNRIPIGKRLTLDAGTRVTFLHSRLSWYGEPRLSVRFDASESRLGPWSARLATGLYRQYVTQFDVTSRSARALRSSSRMWMALDKTVAPPKAAHVSLEAVVKPSGTWSVRAEGYYKQLMHLLTINYVASVPGATLSHSVLIGEYLSTPASDEVSLPSQAQSSFLSSGSGYAFGLSFYSEKRLASLLLKAGYEFSHTARSFGAQFEGRTVAAPWNEPHRLELEADYHATPSLVMQARWQSIWGKTWGFRQSYYDFLGAYGRQLLELLESPRRNPNDDFDILSVPVVVEHIRAYRLEHPEEHQLPAVHQVDLSVAYTHAVRSTRVQLRADAINLLGFNNVADWGLVRNADKSADSDLLVVKERTTLPVTPSLALRLIW